MIRRYRRRGVIAYIRRAFNWIARAFSDEPEGPERPFRARPSMIFIRERYYYSLTIERNTNYNPEPDQASGFMMIDLPFNQMGRDAIADAKRAVTIEPSEVTGRYGWLGFSKVVKTDVHERFPTVRHWPRPYFHAFPLTAPLLDQNMALLEQRIEAGAFEREFLTYTPATPRPFPFRVNLFMSRDCQVQAEPDIIDPVKEQEIVTPTIISGRQMAIHVQIEVKMNGPSDGTGDQSDITLDRFDISWPVPLVPEQFHLKDAPDGTLSVDSRENRLRVSGIKANHLARGGFLHGFIKFRIVVKQPSLLQGIDKLKGHFRLKGSNTLLSGMRLQYFDALGYPQNKNSEGKDIFIYASEVWVNFEFRLAEVLRDPPMLLERQYSWISNESCKSAFYKIEQNLRECHFQFADPVSTNGHEQKDEEDKETINKQTNKELNQEANKDHAKWRVSRILNGQPLIMDVEVQKQDLPRTLLEPLMNDQKVESMDSFFRKPLTRSHYDLKINAYYRGQWEKATEQLQTLEDRLRQRLQLRQRG